MNGVHDVLAVTSWGLQCALGDDPAVVLAALGAGRSGVGPHLPLLPLGRAMAGAERAGVVAGPDLRPWLKRRKDGKLLARAAELALAAAGPAVAAWPGAREDLGLYLAVGREPPDDGDSEAALVAANVDGRLDETRLAAAGRDLYPPLLPLKTLPNMALAHISIHLDVCGPNGVWAGGAEAGAAALRAAWWAVAEGRCPAAMVGGCDSLVDLGQARDRWRAAADRGDDPSQVPAPGEAAACFVIEPLAAARERGAAVLGWVGPTGPAPSPADGADGWSRGLVEGVGDVGAASLPLLWVLTLARRATLRASG